MNKPTKQTVSALRSALDGLEHALHHTPEADRHATLTVARDNVRAALAQLTQDDKLQCPNCHVQKPTRRALAAHQTTHTYDRSERP